MENYINEFQFNAQKSEKENRLIEAFNKKYINLSHMDTGDLSYDLVDQLRELRSKLQKFVSKTDEMLISAEKLLGKDNINENTSPLLVIEILAELYSLLESKKPTIGNSSNMSEFEQFAYIASLKIGYKEDIRKFSQKLAHRRWIHRSLVKKLIIPKII